MKLINYIESPKKFNVENLINFVAKELGISEEAELTICYNDILLDKLSTKDLEYEALLQNTLPNKYVLYVKENVSGLQFILCHEMIHLYQYDRGDLKMSSDFKTITWKGKEYTNDLDYSKREWEKEAFSLDNKLWKKFKNENKCR